jgi:cytochrome b subunit of formate dehydrogenase
MKKRSIIRRTVAWSLAITTLVFLISGFGITEFRVVEAATLGLFTKPLAFKLHEVIWIPFLVLIITHIYLGITRKKQEV